MKKLFLFSLAALFLVSGNSAIASPKKKEKNKAVDEKIERAIISLSGLKCKDCIQKVEKAVKSLPGIKELKVSLKKANILFDSKKVSTKKILEKIKEAGFKGNLQAVVAADKMIIPRKVTAKKRRGCPCGRRCPSNCVGCCNRGRRR